ncbi:MAG: trypsin-like peptidase domain-containing protein [Candidatus Glassbacteria bacterium]|nr:trypsin-like peptidase domain-containing protein [Candidatus Glassbacteria bacterium]
MNADKLSKITALVLAAVLSGLAMPAQAERLEPEAGNATADQLNSSFMEIAEKVTPTVVSIISSRSRRSSGRRNSEDLVHMGSGVIVSADGYILTNNHVIEGADKISLKLIDGRIYDAQVIGTDYTTDLAVLKIELLENGTRLPVVAFGDSDSCRIGAWVMAIGNPMDLGLTVTAGIISAKNRRIDILSDHAVNLQGNFDQSIESFIQTDAVINPGNSGGGLINIRGELIGINTAIASSTGVYQGYGFAIPVNLARRVMEDLITMGRVVRPVLGVLIRSLDPVMAKALGLESPQGVLIDDFVPREGSPAEQAGLRRGDVVVEVDGRPVNFSHQLQESIAKLRPGDLVELTVVRQGRRIRRSVLLGSREIGRQVSVPELQPGPEKTTTLGMQLRELTGEDAEELDLVSLTGVVVEKITEGGAAFKSGMLPGDVLLEVNRQAVNSVAAVSGLLDDLSSGDAVLFLVMRGGITQFVGLQVP